MQHIPFSNNYQDHSTETGFRFEFFCQKCRDGYLTEFKPYTLGTINSIIDVGESLFGGIFHSAGTVADKVHSATWERTKDQAFIEAAQEATTHFFRCSRCGHHYCRNCWNPSQGLCTVCAPLLAQEIEAAKRQAAISQAQQLAYQGTYVTQEDITPDLQVTCPKCKSPTGKGVFCPVCGTKLGMKKTCMNCRAEMPMDANFCLMCGSKT